MSNVSLGGQKNVNVSKEQTKQKMIYLNIPTAIIMVLELGDSKNIKKYADPIISSIKQSLSNKELRKIICPIFGVKTARKFRKMKSQEFELVTKIFGDIWGLKNEKN